MLGEYEPSTWSDARDQVALFEKSHGAEGNTLFGLPVVVIIITTTGKSTGKLRKTPLMRVDAFPGCADYRATASRRIPVMLLEPLS